MNALVFILTTSLAFSAERVVTLGADPWCPYTCDPTSKEKGYIIEIAEKAFSRHNIKVIYKAIPWARAVNETREGRLDAIAGAYTTDAPGFIFPKKYQTQTRNCFYTLPETQWSYKNIDSLKKKTIGIVQDYSYSPEIDKAIGSSASDVKFEAVSGTQSKEMNIEKLKNHRITTFIEEESVMNFFLKHQTTPLKTAGCLKHENTYIAFSPHASKAKLSNELSQILDEEMRNLEKSGELATLKKKYNVK